MSRAEQVGSVAALWRFPVKSMQGEQLTEVELGTGGIAGDRAYGLIDRETGKVASAKSVKLFSRLFECRASFVEPPRAGSAAAAGVDRATRRRHGPKRQRRV